MAILEWINRNVDYVSGVSSVETTAERTFVDRAGVCRNFAHLGITFARALGIPARAVSAYALDLNPPDFHAVFEVYLEPLLADRSDAACSNRGDRSDRQRPGRIRHRVFDNPISNAKF